MVVFESKRVIVRSDKAFFSQREANNCSEIWAGKKISGSLKLSLVKEQKLMSFMDAAAEDAVTNRPLSSLVL